MADNNTSTNTSQGGATAPTSQNTANTGTGERTFSQADVDRMIAERLSREQKKYADYDALKAAKEELNKLKDGQKRELEKANAPGKIGIHSLVPAGSVILPQEVKR